MREKQGLFNQLKQIAINNRKLLQSISANLLNTPDDIQMKGNERRSLLQRYNELIGYSHDNVASNEKMHEQIYNSNQKINVLKQQIMYSKQHYFQQQEKIKKQYDQVQAKYKQQSLYYNFEIQRLKGQSDQYKKNHNKQKRRYTEQIQKYKQQINKKQKQIKNLQNQARQQGYAYEQKIRQMQKIINDNNNDIMLLHKKSQSLQSQLGKKVKLNALNGARQLLVDYKKRKT